MKNFITNSGVDNLKGRLIELIEKSKELKFLVGFFYFSGIRELYDSIKINDNVTIKILIGLYVDNTNYGIMEYADTEDNKSDEEKRYRFLNSIKKSLNSETFDTKEFYEQVKYFVKLINENRLIIRKTYNPNHAKVYIFKLDDDQVGRKTLFITGSSNLTGAGIATQEEFNVEISDYGFEDAEKYFDFLWDEAVKITEDDNIKNRLVNVVEKETLIKEITPFHAFALLLKIYLDSFEQKETGQSLIKTFEDNGYKPYRYQLDAIRQALATIEKNSGVIIADVVGLGKTVVACAIAKELKKRGIVICPPGLIGDMNKHSGWKKYVEEFKLYDWEIRSLGILEDTLEFVNNTANDIEVIIIDEAHRFRNQDTKDYELLKNICRNKIVILLTATPFNNRPGDILSLLKLFVTPKKSAITMENDLTDRFRFFKGIFDRLGYIRKYSNSLNKSKSKKAQGYYEGIFGEKTINLDRVKKRSKYLAKQIRDVIEPVTIRRNRLDLQSNPLYRDEIKNLSKVQDPKEWFFKLTKEQSVFYDKIIKVYFGAADDNGMFKGAIYRPFEYEVEREKISCEKLTQEESFQFTQQRNLFDFMRRLIVKRFESSFGSFEQSIKNFKNITKHILEFIEKTGRYILDRSLIEKIYDFDIENIENSLKDYTEKINAGVYPKNHKIYEINKFKYKNDFLNHIKSDLGLFETILNELNSLNLVKKDPKTDCLLENINEVLKQEPNYGEPKRKIVIFSEYLDTIKFLGPILKQHFDDRLLVVSEDLSSQQVLRINENFDASYKNQDDKYDILLASDRISEGFNLNRAGMVVNYDIPWNPVRVIQRVGRINRIGKKVFKDLYIVNFFPTEQGSALIKSREIAANKMFLIHNTLGEDAKIFGEDEEPTPAGLFNKIQQNPDNLEEESFYVKALKEFLRIKGNNPKLIEELKEYPRRIKVAKKSNGDELLVFIKKGRLYINGINYNNEYSGKPFQATFEEIFDKVTCSEDENSLPLSERFWDAYENIKKFKSERYSFNAEQSLETKALNNIKTLINLEQWDELFSLKDFLRTLRDDILDYGTLSDYTLRRIINLEFKTGQNIKKTVKEINNLKQELGENYLLKEKEKQKHISKEIIIAIENRLL